jgi:hypothetical protein
MNSFTSSIATTRLTSSAVEVEEVAGFSSSSHGVERNHHWTQDATMQHCKRRFPEHPNQSESDPTLSHCISRQEAVNVNSVMETQEGKPRRIPNEYSSADSELPDSNKRCRYSIADSSPPDHVELTSKQPSSPTLHSSHVGRVWWSQPSPLDRKRSPVSKKSSMCRICQRPYQEVSALTNETV